MPERLAARRRVVALARSCVLALALFPATVPAAQERKILGWLERAEIGIDDQWVSVRAKLDSGARSSSLHATGIEAFERDGETWVRFTISWDDQDHDDVIEPVTFERPAVGKVRIKRHRGRSEVRSVVSLEVCVGGQHRLLEVNLVDRSRFLYPLLLGRRTLAGWALIDPQRTYLGEPACAMD